MPKGKYERPKEPMSPRRKTLLTIIGILSALLVIGLIIIAVLPAPTPIEPPTEKPVVEATTEPTATEPPEESEAIVEPEETEPVLVATASLGATGDILLHKGVINSGKTGTNTYNFDEIFKYVTEHPESQGMGTTIVLAILTPAFLLIGNIGDSSGYVYKNKKLHEFN